MAAMLSAENMRRPSSCQCSCCSSNTAPTRRMIEASLGKMPTTLVRRLMEELAERTSRCDVDPLQQVGAPDLAPVVLGEVAERQHVLLGLVHERSGFGKALRQRGGQIIPARLDLRGCFLGKHAAQGSGDHALVSFRDALEQVAGEMHPAALPHTALQLAADRLGEADVGVRDHQLDASKAPLFEVGDELRPEGLGLTVADLETQKLPPAIGMNPHGDYHSARGDLLSPAKPALEVGGIQVDVGIASLLQRPAQESLDLLINFLTDAGSPEIPGD